MENIAMRRNNNLMWMSLCFFTVLLAMQLFFYFTMDNPDLLTRGTIILLIFVIIADIGVIIYRHTLPQILIKADNTSLLLAKKNVTILFSDIKTIKSIFGVVCIKLKSGKKYEISSVQNSSNVVALLNQRMNTIPSVE